MADQKLAALVVELSKKTADGKLVWEKTAEENTFQTAFPGYSIRLRPVTSRQYPGADAYGVQIFNEAGEIIEEASDEELPAGSYSVMKVLFANARRNVMGVDKAIDSILQELADNA